MRQTFVYTICRYFIKERTVMFWAQYIRKSQRSAWHMIKSY